jgi:hypothetical protein
MWPHNDTVAYGVDGCFCRVRRALAPLLAASLVDDEDGNSVFVARRGRYWKGCAVPLGGLSTGGCAKDSLDFSEHDRAWLEKLRPLIASELADDEGCTRSRPTRAACIGATAG